MRVLRRLEKTPPLIYPVIVMALLVLVYVLASNRILPVDFYRLLRDYTTLVFAR